MTPTMIISPLTVAMADAVASGLHFMTFTEHGIAVCRICSRMWNLEAYTADTTKCPGYSTCGLDPVGTQPLSIGPAA